MQISYSRFQQWWRQSVVNNCGGESWVSWENSLVVRCFLFSPSDYKGAVYPPSLFFLRPLQCSVQFSHSVVSDPLPPHWLQHARLPCPSPTPGAYSNSCPLSWWCHPTISSSVVSFSSCLQSFPGSGSFPTSWLFVSGGHALELQLQHQSFQWIFRTDFL